MKQNPDPVFPPDNTLHPDTVLSVQAAWARILGVPPESLAGRGTRIYREKNDSSVLMFVSLFGVGILVGPEWAITAAHGLTDRELARHAKLLEISSPHGGRPLGEAGLYFRDSVLWVPEPEFTNVSRASEHALALEHACSREDRAEAGLSEMANTFVLLGNESPDPRPLAGSGYDIWDDRLAHMGVLTAPNQRGQGHAATAVTVAVNHAAKSGLIPQWRARTDNTASIRTALSAGFQHAGSQTTVLLNAA